MGEFNDILSLVSWEALSLSAAELPYSISFEKALIWNLHSSKICIELHIASFNKWKIIGSILLHEKVYLITWTAASEWKTPPNIETTAFAQIFFFLSRLTERYSYKKSWSKIIFRISTKLQFQNLHQTSASRLDFNFKILT